MGRPPHTSGSSWQPRGPGRTKTDCQTSHCYLCKLLTLGQESSAIGQAAGPGTGADGTEYLASIASSRGHLSEVAVARSLQSFLPSPAAAISHPPPTSPPTADMTTASRGRAMARTWRGWRGRYARLPPCAIRPDTRIFPRHSQSTETTPILGDPLRPQSSDVAHSQRPSCHGCSRLSQASAWVAEGNLEDSTAANYVGAKVS